MSASAMGHVRAELVVSAHCTGWKVRHARGRELPEVVVPNNLGTRSVL